MLFYVFNYELLEEGMHALFGVLSNYLATV